MVASVADEIRECAVGAEASLISSEDKYVRTAWVVGNGLIDGQNS